LALAYKLTLPVSLEPQSKGNALLLTTNTEVSIAPELRSTSGPGSSAVISTDTASTSTTNGTTTIQTPISKLPPKILRVIPARVLPPLTPSPASYTRSETLTYVSKRTYSQLTNTYPIPEEDESNRQFYKASFRRLKPPVDPADTSGANKSTIPSPPAPRVLNAGGSTGNESKPVDAAAPKKVHELFVGWTEGVPESHIVFPSMIEGVDELDLIR
jgi:peroxin-1